MPKKVGIGYFADLRGGEGGFGKKEGVVLLRGWGVDCIYK